MAIDYSLFRFKKTYSVDEREDKKKSKRSAEDQARATIWRRDRNRDRSTGRILKRGAVDPSERGECCHLRGRNVSPEMREDPAGQVLLSAQNHDRFDGRSTGRLRAFDPQTMQKATNATKPILFIFYDRSGKELARRIS